MDRQDLLAKRRVLQGAGVALALPWLESLAPRGDARASDARAERATSRSTSRTARLRFWRPGGAGAGDAWTLSPILEPLAAGQAVREVLTNVANYSPFGGHVEPSHSNLGASTWTCVQLRAATGQRATTASRSTR